MNKTIIAALITGTATIIAGFIGVIAGRTYEQKNTQTVISEAMGDIVNVTSEGNNFIFNDITALTEVYKQLIDENKALEEYKIALDQKNSTLESDNKNLVNEIDVLKQDISSKENSINELESSIIKDIGLVINSVEVDGKYIGIAKNGELLLSTKALEKYFDKIVKWDAANKMVYVGDNEEKIAKEISMWDKPYIDISDTSCFIGDAETKMIGFSAYGFSEYYSPMINSISYALDGKSQNVSGTFFVDTSNTSHQVIISAEDENGNVIYTSPTLTKMYPQHDFSISTTDYLSIKFIFKYTTSGKGTNKLLGEIFNLTNLTIDY